LIIASNKRDNPLGVQDCSCALENIFLAAHSLGIGSVWINQFRTICDVPEVRKALDDIRIPSDHIIVGCAALGYPARGHSFEIRSHPGASEWFL
jgi:nitroreductase